MAVVGGACASHCSRCCIHLDVDNNYPHSCCQSTSLFFDDLLGSLCICTVLMWPYASSQVNGKVIRKVIFMPPELLTIDSSSYVSFAAQENQVWFHVLPSCLRPI